MKFLRENTAEEFIDALGPQDIKFAKMLMKKLLKKHLGEEVSYVNDDNEIYDTYEFFDSEEFFKGEINYYFDKKREAKDIKKLVKRKRK